jgi:hypothetical protein
LTVTTPTQTLYTTECGQVKPPSQPNPYTNPTPNPNPNPNPNQNPTPIYNIPPVTLTRTSTSTDPSGNIVLQTIAYVSTPLPDPNQYSSGSGGPNTVAIVGGVVGGVVGLIALIAGFLVYRKMKRRHDYGGEDDAAYYAEAVKY